MRAWVKIFCTGLGLWVAAVVVTAVTSNPNLVPTVVLLGSFLVPVTFVAWAYGRGHAAGVTVELLFQSFIVGGVLGVLGASLLEGWLLRPSVWVYLGVGFIEEGVKLAALMFVARRMTRRTGRDGLVLGATVGFGFAAFESAGYAFNALFAGDGLSLSQLVETEVLRGLLAPVGHGLWTAIVGGVLFGRGFRISGAVLGAYAGVAVLHALWDSMSAIAIAITLVLTGRPWQFQALRLGQVPEVTTAQVHLYTVLNWAGLLLVSLVALAWLLDVSRRVRYGPPRGLA
ncbi:RsiW-degrading membrane proteinase PrsW (M82 family) [Thermocatellispora tengchongensis]|uniref:RsiW-degrading membrane proteinase PrsW (M82 family) n=1 Tax=Thermocatellispora tengchongensis TaxID=1073253 RepID=A0A840PFX0_9ACTN|nr:PrsW family glutamic-type intramembrane protease [Thermocatellispora tengchongensis]MBB5134935.1 RsiW-degrading membrane proteinase PrsW (M82 family) [Thermocatellispora tengchongensis]